MALDIKYSLLKWGSRLVTAVLVAAFVLWGAVGLVGAPSSDVMAEIGNSEITISDYKKRLNRYARKKVTMARYLDATPQQRFEMAEAVFQSMLANTILKEYANSNGLIIPDEVVIEKIKLNKDFKGRKGNFDQAIFEKIIQDSGVNREEYIESQKQEILINLISNTFRLPDSANSVPFQAAVPYFRYKTNMKNAKYIPLSSINVKLPVPSPEELMTFYQKNGHLFSAQELRSFQYIVINKQPILERWSMEIDITEEEAEKAYQSRKHFYTIPEQLDIRQMVFDNEKDAITLQKEVQGKEKEFDKIARKLFSRPISQLEKVEKNHLLPELSEYAFSAEVGKISKPIKSKLGWHVMRVVAHYPEYVPSRDEIIDDIKILFTKDKAEKMFEETINSAQQYGSSALTNLSREFRVKVNNISDVDSEGYPDGNTSLERIDIPSNLLAHIFAQTPEDGIGFIQPIEGKYIAFKVDKIVPAKIKAFDASLTTKEWAKRKRIELNRKRAVDIVKKVNEENKTIDDIANEMGLKIQYSDYMSQVSDLLGDFSPYLRDRLFKAGPNQVIDGPSSNEDLWIIAQVFETKESEENKEEIEIMRNKIGAQINDSLSGFYMASLSGTVPIRINNSAYQQVLEEATFTPSTQ